jgi:hypothetical protein
MVKVKIAAKKPKKLKSERGRVKLLKVFPYLGKPIYLRQIGNDYFEYCFIHNNELYSSYVIFKPREGKKRISKKDINSICTIILSGALASIDQILIEEKQETLNINKVEA